jgi:hypothetical protein
MTRGEYQGVSYSLYRAARPVPASGTLWFSVWCKISKSSAIAQKLLKLAPYPNDLTSSAGCAERKQLRPHSPLLDGQCKWEELVKASLLGGLKPDLRP